MSKPTPARTEIGPYATRVAALAALVIAATVALLLIAGSKDTYEVKAVFDDVRGLIVGGDVTAGFQKVGTITAISFTENDDPEVTMRIDGDFQLHQGAFADLRLSSNVGAVNRIVDLEQGDEAAPGLGDGATLGPTHTDQPVDLDLAVSTLDPRTRGNLSNLLAGLDHSIAGRGGDLDRTLLHSATALNETANLLGEVNADGEAIRTVVSQGRRVVGALASSPRDLAEAADRTAALLNITAARQTELARATVALGPALANGRVLLEHIGAATPHLRELVGAAGPLVDELGPLARRLPAAARTLEPFLAQTKKLVRETPALLRSQRPVLARAKPLIKKFDPALSLLNPVVDTLRVHTPEVAGFFQNFADLESNYDANGHLARLAYVPIQMPRASTTSGGLVGPSASGPGLIARPFDRDPGAIEGDPWSNYYRSFVGGGESPRDYPGAQQGAP